MTSFSSLPYFLCSFIGSYEASDALIREMRHNYAAPIGKTDRGRRSSGVAAPTKSEVRPTTSAAQSAPVLSYNNFLKVRVNTFTTLTA